MALILGIEQAHVPEVLRREAIATRELRLKVARQRFHHGFPPPERLLLAVDGFANVPVEPSQLRVDRSQRLILRLPDARLDFDKKP